MTQTFNNIKTIPKIKSVTKTLLLLLILSCGTSFSQEQKVLFNPVAVIDSAEIKIGAQITLSIAVSVGPTDLVDFPTEAQSFAPLELVSASEVDSLEYQGKLQLLKKYALTQFDSGSYTIPKQLVLVNNQAYFTTPLKLKVLDVPVDTLKQNLYYIKPLASVEKIATYEWFWQLLFILLSLGALIFAYLRRLKKKRAAAERELPPYDKALLALDQLENSQYLIKEEYKAYYSELTNIVRGYLEEEVHIAALESTTDQLIERLELLRDSGTLTLEQETITQFKQILQTADLVKFAKSTPEMKAAEQDRSKLKQIVVKTKASIAPPTEEELAIIAASESAKKANEINKSRKRKVVLVAAILLSLCFAAIGYYGPQNLWDTALRNPTKILLEKDWIKSEYGVPAIVIETPEALERSLDVVLNSGEKSVQQFYYKHPKGVLFLDIETKMLVSDKAPDFNALTEQGLKNLESLGAKNIITKQENFEAQEGVKGIKTFGTADFALDGDKSLTKEDYILLYFGGKGFVQSIGMRWIDKDEYAEQISQKIMESIAFEKIALPQNPK
jgi:hypothetical protein